MGKKLRTNSEKYIKITIIKQKKLDVFDSYFSYNMFCLDTKHIYLAADFAAK